MYTEFMSIELKARVIDCFGNALSVQTSGQRHCVTAAHLPSPCTLSPRVWTEVGTGWLSQQEQKFKDAEKRGMGGEQGRQERRWVIWVEKGGNREAEARRQRKPQTPSPSWD